MKDRQAACQKLSDISFIEGKEKREKKRENFHCDKMKSNDTGKCFSYLRFPSDFIHALTDSVTQLDAQTNP